MKKTLYSLFIFCCSNICLGQITIAGASPNGLSSSNNGTYNLSNYIPSINGITSSKDAGTNLYLKNNTNQITSYFIVYRAANYWYIANYYNAGYPYSGSYIMYKYNTYSTSIDPPCQEFWEKYNPPVTATPSAVSTPSGNMDLLTITGSCISFPLPNCNTSFSIFPTHLQLPTIAGSMSSLSPIDNGTLTYDCLNKKLMLFDGLTWRMVQGSKDDIILNSTGKVSFENDFQISQGNSELKVSKINTNLGTTNFLNLNSDGFSKVGINIQFQPNSSVELGGSISNTVKGIYDDYTLTNYDRYLIFVGTVTKTITLPNPSGLEGRIYTISNNSAVTLNFAGFPIWKTNTTGNYVVSLPTGEGIEIIVIASRWCRINK